MSDEKNNTAALENFDWRSALDIVRDAIVVFDMHDYTVIDSNRSARLFFGVDSTAGIDISDFLSKIKMEGSENIFKIFKKIGEHETITFECLLERTRHSSLQRYEATLKQVPAKDGTKALLAIHDIGKGKQALTEVMEVLNYSDEGIILLEPLFSDGNKITNFKWKFVNKAGEKIINFKNIEIAGKDITAFAPEHFNIEELIGNLKKVAAKADMTLNYEMARKNVIFQVSISKPGDDFLLMISDVTRRRKELKELQKKIGLNEIIVDSLPCPVALIGEDKAILSANNAAQELGMEAGSEFGDFLKECLILDSQQRVQPDSVKFFNTLTDAVFTNSTPLKLESVLCKSKKWEMNLMLIAENVFLFYAMDVTELINTKAELMDMLKGFISEKM